jgi:hypothetical protein
MSDTTDDLGDTSNIVDPVGINQWRPEWGPREFGHARDVGAELMAANAELDYVRHLLDCLTPRTECSLDDAGACREHRWFNGVRWEHCPTERSQELLGIALTT